MAGDGAFVFFKIAPHQRNVAAVYGVVKKLFGHVSHGFGRFCQHQQTGGIFINAVYHAKTGQAAFLNIRVLLF